MAQAFQICLPTDAANHAGTARTPVPKNSDPLAHIEGGCLEVAFFSHTSLLISNQTVRWLGRVAYKRLGQVGGGW